jgi:DNA-binding MarR family transcriptional regulator
MDLPKEDSLYAIFGQVIRFHYSRMHMLFEKIGVYPGQQPILFALGKQDGLSQKELAKKLYIKAATITVMLNRMENANLIERRPDEHDQRISRVYLTPKGKEIRSELITTLKQIVDECFSNFTPEEQILLRRLFMQMRDNLMKACGENFEE